MELKIELSEEQLEEVFENAEVKFSKLKLKKLASMMVDVEIDVKERLEIEFMDALEEMVVEEWGD